MSRHLRLRLAVLTAVAVGAMLVPAAEAVADSTPSPVPSATTDKTTAAPSARDKAVADKQAAAAKAAAQAKAKAVAGKTAPRGAVAAGEEPIAHNGNDNGVTALVGSATGALLLAGAGTYVLRRRSAVRHDG
ncbi:colicin import membrane protein [Streptomyces sp. DvalAA-14]|uniref:hypothetical protein n=1 Tax=unclassified Streptomyces TaxID=2593676 RepID=UPI00081B3095|nr:MULTISPECIES: hypothetical protein [unclassified Streptomyces]MYS22316.1 hypothetical protein [Streptomyces sp. SID4948]SCE13774.1 colicin import membrane protein [Streptomyces sp. DvalAA-14]